MATTHAQPKAGPFRQRPQLFDAYDYCAARGIGAYGGGMFEQGPGRGQLSTWLRCSIPMVRTTSPRGGHRNLQHGERSSALSAPAGATPDRLPLGELRRAPQCPRAIARGVIGARHAGGLAPVG